ncbi:hypothetical protein JDV02_008407 [Purpureocillium takamizusanense]|uniref:F-box domain-containing protein n=1 Tax=Purpureocillium takamizusanense TaxID=2060973 RepID=A0A9Q8QNR6_9HYPO|nr:uncharacterized protein JDV02_008407 [Purpureocillium takamizusanense]UNI22526.1 hypothetical protein JDV02_008407 [Purpureocillium takamizusanense]
MSPTLRQSSRRPLQRSCRLTRAFKIPKELIAYGGNPGPLLARLPTELLVRLFAEAEPVDDIILAFSCKALLSVAALCHLKVPDPTLHRKRRSLSAPRDTGEVSCCLCLHMSDLLCRLRPRDSRRRIDRTWNLCVDCCRYLPTRRGYWAAQLAQIDTSAWSRAEDKSWQLSVKWFAAGIKVQCPRCRLVEYMGEEE